MALSSQVDVCTDWNGNFNVSGAHPRCSDLGNVKSDPTRSQRANRVRLCPRSAVLRLSTYVQPRARPTLGQPSPNGGQTSTSEGEPMVEAFSVRAGQPCGRRDTRIIKLVQSALPPCTPPCKCGIRITPLVSCGKRKENWKRYVTHPIFLLCDQNPEIPLKKSCPACVGVY